MNLSWDIFLEEVRKERIPRLDGLEDATPRKLLEAFYRWLESKGVIPRK